MCYQATRSLLTGLFGAVLIAGCGDRHPEGETGVKSRLFGATFQTLDNPVFVDINDGLKEIVEAHGHELVTLDAGFSSSKQKQDIAELLRQEPAVLFVNPVNWEGIKSSLIDASRKGVPVIIVDAPVSDPDLVLCQVASDNHAAGQMACEALASVNAEAQVVIVHLSLNRACIDRVDGFESELRKHPGMKILDVQDGKGTFQGARPVMEELLDRFPQLDAVFAINDPSALGCIAAIEAAGRGGTVTVVSVDGSEEGIEAIKEGKLHATVAQSPGKIGRRAAVVGLEYLEGRPVERDIKIPVTLITNQNVGGFLFGR